MLKSVMKVWLVSFAVGFACFGCGPKTPIWRPPVGESHEVLVSGTTAPFTYSQDTVLVHSNDIITWRHVSDDVGIQVILRGVPVSHPSLDIAPNTSGSVQVDRVTERRVYEYTVVLLAGNMVVTDDPYIDIQP